MGLLPSTKLLFRWSAAAIILCSLHLLTVEPAIAGNWRVNPIKLYFGPQQRSAVINIINEGEQNLTLDVRAVEWSQDHAGKDIYTPSNDLIFFPKALTVEPNQERIIRAGVKVPAVTREKTYRLFIKEIAPPNEASSTAVAIAIQFGVPVFIKPAEENLQGTISGTTVANGQVSTTILNDGNIHFRINTVSLQGTTAAGEAVFAEELQGWYVLSGASRSFATTLPADVCQQIETLKIAVDTDSIKLNGEIDVDKAMCALP